MLKKWLKAGYMEQHVLHPTEEGTPQGGIISPVLANMALDGREGLLRERYPKPKNGYNAKVNFIRYADDFLITGDTKELLEKEVKPLVEQFMSERGLTLSQEKTVITHIGEGFDFLGQNIRTYKDGKRRKLLVKPSKKSIQAHLEKLRDIIKKNPALPADKLITQLNPIIGGWAQYHQHVVSGKIFKLVDDAIYHRLRRWAKRRHPNKPNEWIVKKYFTTHNEDNWVFYGETEGVRRHLRNTAQTPIKRHVKIRGEANPYDPQWEEYYEKRLDVHMATKLTGRRWLLHLWQEQDGLCPICQQKITTITGWQSHHILWKSKGGPDTAENRVLLHPTCHQQIHSQGTTVEKPRPAKGVRKA